MIINSPLVVVEGLFLSHPSRGLIVQTSTGELLPLDLDRFVGEKVSFSVHYLPPNPPVTGLPGLGCCVYISSCQIHKQDPDSLWSFSGEGVLEKDSQGNYSVEGMSLGIPEKMPGHYGRLVVFQLLPPQDSSLESLMGEVEGMQDLLKALKREIS